MIVLPLHLVVLPLFPHEIAGQDGGVVGAGKLGRKRDRIVVVRLDFLHLFHISGRRRAGRMRSLGRSRHGGNQLPLVEILVVGIFLPAHGNRQGDTREVVRIHNHFRRQFPAAIHYYPVHDAPSLSTANNIH